MVNVHTMMLLGCSPWWARRYATRAVKVLVFPEPGGASTWSTGCGLAAIQMAKSMGWRVVATASKKNEELVVKFAGADEVRYRKIF